MKAGCSEGYYLNLAIKGNYSLTEKENLVKKREELIMNTTFENLGICKFKKIPINDFFSYDGDVFLKLNDDISVKNSFNVKTLERTSILDAGTEVTHMKLKSKSSVLLEITYSWGDSEPKQEFDTFDHAWGKHFAWQPWKQKLTTMTMTKK